MTGHATAAAATAARTLAALAGAAAAVAALDVVLFRLPAGGSLARPLALLSPLASGDLGRADDGRRATAAIADGALRTAPLAAAALVAAALVAILVAASAARRDGGADRRTAIVAAALAATPAAVLALLAFGGLGGGLGLFPVAPVGAVGAGSPLARAVLPAAALALALGGAVALPLVRALRAARGGDAAAHARALGVPPHVVRRRLVPRLALADAMRLAPGTTGAALAAVLAVEAIAGRGLGALVADALAGGDRPVLEGLFLACAGLGIAGRAALDAAAAALAPRRSR